MNHPRSAEGVKRPFGILGPPLIVEAGLEIGAVASTFRRKETFRVRKAGRQGIEYCLQGNGHGIV